MGLVTWSSTFGISYGARWQVGHEEQWIDLLTIRSIQSSNCKIGRYMHYIRYLPKRPSDKVNSPLHSWYHHHDLKPRVNQGVDRANIS